MTSIHFFSVSSFFARIINESLRFFSVSVMLHCPCITHKSNAYNLTLLEVCWNEVQNNHLDFYLRQNKTVENIDNYKTVPFLLSLEWQCHNNSEQKHGETYNFPPATRSAIITISNEQVKTRDINIESLSKHSRQLSIKRENQHLLSLKQQNRHVL